MTLEVLKSLQSVLKSDTLSMASVLLEDKSSKTNWITTAPNSHRERIQATAPRPG